VILTAKETAILRFLAKTHGARAEQVAWQFWPGNANYSGRRRLYTAQMKLGKMAQRGLVRRHYGPGSTLWQVSERGHAELRKKGGRR
jgi:hypothetical protein